MTSTIEKLRVDWRIVYAPSRITYAPESHKRTGRVRRYMRRHHTRQCTPEHANSHQSTSMHARARQCTPEHASARQYTPEHANSHQSTPEHARARQCTPQHASARQSTPVHARARQYTPEHASARQSTSMHARARQSTVEQSREQLSTWSCYNIFLTFWNLFLITGCVKQCPIHHFKSIESINL
jgi:hypothetical protein